MNGRENIRSHRWVTETSRWLDEWRCDAARAFGTKLGTIIVFGSAAISIDAPMMMLIPWGDNDNGPST